MTGNKKEYTDDVEIYLEEVKQIPLLSAQEFHTLLLRAAEGDEDAQIELVNANLNLVVNIARKYIGYGVAFSDLIQDGNIGLMKAAKKFATKSSVTFTEYAEKCIEKAIVRGIREMTGTAQISLDTTVNENTGTTLGELVIDNKTPTNFDLLNYSQMKEVLRGVLDTLTQKEKNVLTLRFGLEDGHTRSHDEVAKIFKVTDERIKQIELMALSKLRHPTHSKKLKDFY
ncbi:MAG: sigma-70 family RNA polymerase sigma factor [Selenomonadaceae bacterium]|nr:sigma-70 family RNA polymerase sigma factor [Selenomonadaceae bacterium]